MSTKADDAVEFGEAFEEDDFESDEVVGDEDLDDEDLFEDDPPPPPKNESKRKKAAKSRKAEAESKPNGKSAVTKYLLIAVAAVCVLGGGLWVFMPFFMSGNKAPSYSNQSFQQPAQTQPVAQTQPANQQTLFIEEQPPVPVTNPAPAPAPSAPAVTSNSGPVNQPAHTNGYVKDNHYVELQKMLMAQEKQLARLNELEKLEKIYRAVQEIKHVVPDQKNLSAGTTKLKEENEKLQNMVSSLEKENKDLKGKNIYLRHLHSEQKAEIKALNDKLAQVNTTPKREDRFLSFMSTWQLTGLTSNFVIFRNTKNSSVVRVGRGEMIGGVRIIDIDSYAGIINTSEGDIMFNAG
jgi:FtsZ-binding cell division protein ZapB